MPKLSAEDWQVEIDHGLKFREIFGMEAAWNKLERDFLNDPDSDTAIGPNLVFSMGDTLLGNLNIPDPEVSIIPTHPSCVDRAPKLEAWDNYLIKKLELKDQAIISTTHSYLNGVGIWKIGYDSEFGYDPYYDLGTITNPAGATLTQFNKQGSRIEFNNTNPGMPWCLAVNPQDIVVPWGTRDLNSARWIAHRVIRLNTSIKSDPKYKNTYNLEPNISMESFVDSYAHLGAAKRKFREYKSNSSYDEASRVMYNELWEICDRSNNTLKVICFDHDKMIRDKVDMVQVACGTPYVSGTFVRHPRAFWSTPLAHYLGMFQKKAFDIELQSTKQRRVNGLKFLVSKGLMSSDKLNKLISADIGAIAEADTTDLTGKIQPFPQGSNFEYAQMSAANEQDARETVGFSRNQMGEFDTSSRRTAREATFVQAGSSRRESLRSSMISGLYTNAIRKMNQIMFLLNKRPMFAMVGKDFMQFTPEEVKGDYLYDLTMNSRRNLSRAERKIEALMAAMQFMQMPGADIGQIYSYLLDAVNDPSFEKLIPKPGSSPGGAREGAGAPVPGLPAQGG